jgi:predicted glycogen debranching enzyme
VNTETIDGLPSHRFGRDVLSRLDVAEFGEWIVTNGLGGYASSSLTGLNTRGYHGLLVAALAPPVDRRLILSNVVEVLEVDGAQYELSTLRWGGGTLAPSGYVYLEELRFDGTLPTWRFVGPDFILEKSLSLMWGENSLEIQYNLVWASAPAKLVLSPITAARDYHSREYGTGNFPTVTERNNS